MGIFKKRQHRSAGGNPVIAAEAANLVPLLRSLRLDQVPALERELYSTHRTHALLGGYPSDPELFMISMTVVMPFVLQGAISKPSVDGAATAGTEWPYRAQIVSGAHGMANMRGAETLIGRCVMAGVGEFMKQHGEPLALAQWLTFFHLLALVSGPGGNTMPDPDAIGLTAGLSATIAARGDAPIFLARRA